LTSAESAAAVAATYADTVDVLTAAVNSARSVVFTPPRARDWRRPAPPKGEAPAAAVAELYSRMLWVKIDALMPVRDMSNAADEVTG